MNGAGFTVYGENDDEASMSSSAVSVTDGTNTSEVRPDGFYENGEKLKVETTGYTGSLDDVCTDIDVDFENEDYSATVHNLVFENGLLVRIE
jgi:hypothetical protein